MSIASEHVISEWYVLKGEHRFGPFDYTDLLRMLQEKVIFEFDYAWHGGLTDWQRISEISDFKEQAVRTLISDRKITRGIFIERKHPRFPHHGHLLIHDQKTWWRGQAIEISAGGVGLVMSNSLVIPGQQLQLHFRSFESYPAFNAVGEIVNKRFIQNARGRNFPVQYGFKFLGLSGTGKERLLQILNEAAKRK